MANRRQPPTTITIRRDDPRIVPFDAPQMGYPQSNTPHDPYWVEQQKRQVVQSAAAALPAWQQDAGYNEHGYTAPNRAGSPIPAPAASTPGATSEAMQWREQFKGEHGYYPEEDPTLTDAFRREGAMMGMSGQDLADYAANKAGGHHFERRGWGDDFFQMTGQRPTYDDWRHSSPREYTRTGQLIGGFGGLPPEKPYWEIWGPPEPRQQQPATPTLAPTIGGHTTAGFRRQPGR
jgi:hypothetical protein